MPSHGIPSGQESLVSAVRQTSERHRLPLRRDESPIAKGRTLIVPGHVAFLPDFIGASENQDAVGEDSLQVGEAQEVLKTSV